MKSICLIAANFLREHRWPVVILFAWIILLALVSADFGRERTVPEDVVFFLMQQAIYICVFSAFLAADAIHNDRKSKRILLVLSKAVTRSNYLLASILGTCAMAVGYALVYGVCGVWLSSRAMMPSGGVWSIAMLVMAGSLLAATVALFFSTFLNPYISVAATLLLFAAPGLLHVQRYRWSMWLPGFPILLQIVDFRFNSPWTLNWLVIGIAILESVLFWMLAAAVFERRDIAVPVE